MNFSNAAQLLELCQQHQIPISEAMIRREVQHLGNDPKEVQERMMHSYQIMKQAVEAALTQEIHSMGGLIGGEAVRLKRYREEGGRPLCGTTVSKAINYAMGVLEVNASMGLIVAAPTAGSSGVIPGVFVALQEEYGFTDEQMTHALFNAGAIGFLITKNATVAGAEGGCQAEVGAASAMAASAATELMGGTPEQCMHAAGTAITNILGLVCDPIAGLVEAPCQKRNAMGASNALVSAELSLAGVPNLLPLDEVIDTMYTVGRSIPFELRETALGGIAASPTGCALCKKVFG